MCSILPAYDRIHTEVIAVDNSPKKRRHQSLVRARNPCCVAYDGHRLLESPRYDCELPPVSFRVGTLKCFNSAYEQHSTALWCGCAIIRIDIISSSRSDS